jgi:integrase/recombinase XerD
MEIEGLDERDIHFKDRLLYVRSGKYSKRRAIPLTEGVRDALENYHRQYRTRLQMLRGVSDPAFIVNIHGRRMRGNCYEWLLEKIVVKAGYGDAEPGICLHRLRHSIATHLVQGGMGMVYVKDFLGHSSIDTTQVYARASMAQLKTGVHGAGK